MKTLRSIILCITTIISIQLTQAQAPITPDSTTILMSDNELFDTIKEYDNAEYVKVTPFMIGMAKLMATGAEKEFLDKVKSMRIIALASCSPDDKAKYADLISLVTLKKYEPVTEISDENINMRIYLKMKEDIVTEMIIAQWGTTQNYIMQINGTLSIADIESMSKGNNPNPM